MSHVVLENIVKRFGEHTAVDSVSLVAEPGQLVALLGPSGCGKSTLLRLIAGLERPEKGRIEIAGRDITHAPPAERGVAMVFQNYALFPHLTVAENIIFGLTVRRVDKAERARRLARAAELLGLQTLLGRKPAQLSGGQRQRVALARAIVAEAPVCLMDEPMSNLDAQLRQQMRSEIRELQQRLGITMLYVTHDQIEAMTMADRVVLMRTGRIEQQGTPRDLYERPASSFVASFIGTPAMNLFPSGDGRTLLGVRPEQLRLLPAGQGLPARVAAIEYLGAESLLVCEAAGTRIIVRTAADAAHPLPPRGAEIGLDWPAHALHRFDRDTGFRLN